MVSAPEKQNSKVNVFVGFGGTVLAGDSKILGNTGTDVSVKNGNDLKFVITPDEGYVLDTFQVDEEQIENSTSSAPADIEVNIEETKE